MATVLAAEALGNQDLDRSIQEFASLVAKQFFRLKIYENDAAFLIHDDDAIRSCINQGTKDNISFLRVISDHGDSFSREDACPASQRKGELRQNQRTQAQ